MKAEVETIESFKLAEYKRLEAEFKKADKSFKEIKSWVMDHVVAGIHGAWQVMIKETPIEAYEVKAHVRKQLIVERNEK